MQQFAVSLQRPFISLEPPHEGDWGNPPVESFYFDLYKNAGFNCVRIPVTWDLHTQAVFPYEIDANWLNRVEQIVDWGLARGLFIVINAHHEQWLKSDYANPANQERFDSIWSQISVRFMNKSGNLFFEILNEPEGLTKPQNDELHQRILSIIRKTNPTRIVIFQGNNWGGSDDLINAAIPNDKFVMGSFHSYDPYTFGLLGQGTWGTPSDIATLTNKFAAVKNWSVANNIPVFMGEFGAIKSCDYNSRMKDYKTYVELAQKNNFVYCAWDDGGDFIILERLIRQWNEIKDILVNSTINSPGNPKLSILQDTIILLNWTNLKSDYDSIYIERKASSGNFLRIASLNGDTMRFLDLNRPQNQDYYYRVIAHYNAGTDLYSYPQTIFLPAYQSKVRKPFLGAPANIPGTIEAENFDYGGEGLAYHDSDPANLGGAYRPAEGVDISNMNGNGYEISNALPGEWLEYTVNVEKDAMYNIDVYLGSVQSGGTFKIKIGDSESGTMTVINSDNWMKTLPVSTTMNLASGVQIMRFSILAEPLFTIDKYIFSLATFNNNIGADKQPFRVFQNADHQLAVSTSDDITLTDIRIYNASGTLIQSIQQPQQYIIINTSKMPAGLYIINANSNNFKYSEKIILN